MTSDLNSKATGNACVGSKKSATWRASFAMYNTRAEVDAPCASPNQGAGFVPMSDEKPISEQPVEQRTEDNPISTSALAPEELARLGEEIIAALKTVYDPEIPADLYELGLIYKINVNDDRIVSIDMTLTTPNCPSAA